MHKDYLASPLRLRKISNSKSYHLDTRDTLPTIAFNETPPNLEEGLFYYR
jgi:hypothetical protein